LYNRNGSFAKEWDLLTDNGRLRRAAFNVCLDTVAMLQDQIGQYRDARLLPRETGGK
jgi:hypothetical protein